MTEKSKRKGKQRIQHDKDNARKFKPLSESRINAFSDHVQIKKERNKFAQNLKDENQGYTIDKPKVIKKQGSYENKDGYDKENQEWCTWDQSVREKNLEETRSWYDYNKVRPFRVYNGANTSIKDGVHTILMK